MTPNHMTLIQIAIGGIVAWMIYSAIKHEKGERRKKAIAIYLAIIVVAIGAYFMLTTFGREMMSSLFYWFGGTVKTSF